MPLYEYKCDQCGEVFEVRQKFSDEPLSTHEACGGGPVHRLISAPSFQFKGSGWYVTDYAKSPSGSNANGESGGSKSEKSGDTGAGKKDASTTTTSGDSKPAATTSNSGKSE